LLVVTGQSTRKGPRYVAPHAPPLASCGSPMKAGRLAFIVIAGFLAGLGGHIAVDRLTFDRADRIADVFQALCLGANDTDSGALGLHPRLGYAGEWVDTRSRTLIVHNGSGCSVNAFDAHNLSSSEVGALVTRIERVVARDFPALTLEPDTNPDDATLERFWMSGDFRAPDRWGIIL